MAPDAVTVDLFGTLVDFSIDRDETPLVERLLQEAGAQVPARRALSAWFTHSMAERGRVPFRSVRRALIVGAQAAAEELELDIQPEAWARELEALWASRPLFEDALPGLQRLEAAGVPVAIVTNLDQHVLARVLERTGLDRHVEAAICSEVARAYKPHPRPWQLALDRLGVDPARAVHIGDSRREDLPGARVLGMMACHLVDGTAHSFTRAVAAVLADGSAQA